MVRLVFRPYTQFRRSICTSESLRTSIRVSPDFVLTRHSSPSFGSQRVRSGCASGRDDRETPRECGPERARAILPRSTLRPTFTFIAPLGLFNFNDNPMTRAHVRLLGPCFKTGPESTQSSSVADRYDAPHTRGGAVEPVRGHRRLTANARPATKTRFVNPCASNLPTSLNALSTTAASDDRSSAARYHCQSVR